jgi:hypothetical protein
MPKVNLPPGCSRLAFDDGGRPAIATRPGGSVVVSDERAKAIDSMRGNGEGGLVHASFREYGDVKKAGRWCQPCRRLWYAWCTDCPKCGQPTVSE